MNTKGKKKLSIYCRPTVGDLTVEKQMEIVIKCAKRLNYSYEIFIDKGRSGNGLNRGRDRREFFKLLSHSISDGVSDIFIYNLDILSDSVQSLARLWEIFSTHNINIHTAEISAKPSLR